MSTWHDSTARSMYAARTGKQTRRIIDLLSHSPVIPLGAAELHIHVTHGADHEAHPKLISSMCARRSQEVEILAVGELCTKDPEANRSAT